MLGEDLPKRGLGDVLQRQRERRGLTRRDLATLASLSYPYLAELENGAKYPSHDALVRLAGALDMEVVDLEDAARKAQYDIAAHEPTVNAVVGPLESEGIPDPVDVLTRQVLVDIEPAIRRAIRAAVRDQA